MQPSWVPALRAGIGATLILCALIAMAWAWPWRGVDFVLLIWLGLGAFLVWASRSERSGTRVTPEDITVTIGRRVERLTREDILDLRHDRAEGRARRVQAVVRDGRTVTLLGAPPEALDALRAWHLAAPGRGR